MRWECPFACRPSTAEPPDDSATPRTACAVRRGGPACEFLPLATSRCFCSFSVLGRLRGARSRRKRDISSFRRHRRRTLPPLPYGGRLGFVFMAGRFQRATARQIICLAVAFHVVFLGSISLGRCLSARSTPASHNAQAAELPPLGEPTGAARCVFCHATEVEGYARSAMAHSLRRAAQEPGGTVAAGDTKITMHSSAGGYWQRWENGEDKSEYRVDYVVGSGSHASGYLIDLGGHLFQSPVAYYKSRQSYDLAPGYENLPDPDFTRPVSEECLLCHSGTALHIPGTLNQYRPPIFAATGITCERCHGPVEKHLADPRAGTIVNPAKLEPGARDSVCEQCHLFGSTRVPNPGKKLSDFVPGHRLEETYTIYHNATPPARQPAISR